MKLTLRHYAFGAIMATAGAAFASADLDIYLSTDGSAQAGSVIGLPTTNMTIGVWAVSANGVHISSLDVALGIGTANGQGTGFGDVDGKVDFQQNTAFDVGASLINRNGELTTLGSTVKQGLRSTLTGSGARPWGTDVSMIVNPAGSGDKTLSSTPYHILDLLIKNTGITAGHFYDIQVYDFGSGSSRTTFGNQVGTTTVFRPGSHSYRLTAVPEPGSFIALGLGAAALLIRRRRKVA